MDRRAGKQAPAQSRITPCEAAFVAWITLAVLIVTSLPYAYAYLSSPPDKQFMGLMLDVPDHAQYLSWWRGFQHRLLIENKLTPEPNRPIFFNLLWWTLAQVSRWTGVGYAPLYQAFRWVSGGSFLWAAYRLIARLVPQLAQRRAAFLLVTFSSGLGWVLIALKYTLMDGRLLFPLDVYIPDGNSFLCILGYPHLAFAVAFIMLIFEQAWRGYVEGRLRPMVTAGLLALLLGWQHAYDLLMIYGVLGVFVLLVWWKQRAFPWRLVAGVAVIALLSCSGAVYSLILTTVDPLWEEVLAQFSNAGVYTPSPPHLVVLFGLPLILALVAVGRRCWRRRWREVDLLVLAWFLAGAVLIYAPADFQIHMLNGWQVPMMILAAQALYDWRPARLNEGGLAIAGGAGIGRRALLAFVAFAALTNVYLWAWRFVELRRHDYPYYLHRDETAALAWLEENAPSDAVVFSSLTVGQYVPALSGQTAFLAHWAQTARFYDKRERVARFFDAQATDAERAETLVTFGVDYVIRGPAERALGAYDPARAPWLTLAFSTPQVDVYAVRWEALMGLVESEGAP